MSANVLHQRVADSNASDIDPINDSVSHYESLGSTNTKVAISQWLPVGSQPDSVFFCGASNNSSLSPPQARERLKLAFAKSATATAHFRTQGATAAALILSFKHNVITVAYLGNDVRVIASVMDRRPEIATTPLTQPHYAFEDRQRILDAGGYVGEGQLYMPVGSSAVYLPSSRGFGYKDATGISDAPYMDQWGIIDPTRFTSGQFLVDYRGSIIMHAGLRGGQPPILSPEFNSVF